MFPEEWESFLRTGTAAAEPQPGYGSTEWDPGWEHSTGVDINDEELENLGRWRDPKDALRRAVTSQWSHLVFHSSCTRVI